MSYSAQKLLLEHLHKAYAGHQMRNEAKLVAEFIKQLEKDKNPIEEKWLFSILKNFLRVCLKPPGPKFTPKIEVKGASLAKEVEEIIERVMKNSYKCKIFLEVQLRGVTPKFEAKPARFHGLPEEDTAKLKVQEDIAHCSKNQQSEETENLNLSKAVNPSKPRRRIITSLMRVKKTLVHKKAKDSTDQRTSDVVGQNSAIACHGENTKALQNAVFPYEFEDNKCIVLVTYSIADISHDPDSLKIEFETNSYRVRGETTDGNRFEIKENNLMAEIMPEKSHFEIYTNILLVMLSKKIRGNDWSQLHAVE